MSTRVEVVVDYHKVTEHDLLAVVYATKEACRILTNLVVSLEQVECSTSLSNMDGSVSLYMVLP